MLERNFHTHTARCGHAAGSDEQYVENAIRGGVKILGFSDHAPYHREDPGERMNLSELNGYVQSITALKQKYADQIEIHLGLEVECYKDQWDLLAQYRKDFEYLILGQHELCFQGESSYDIRTPAGLNTYADLIGYACEHGLCDIIAHPDVCMWSYPVIDDTVQAIAERIAALSLHYDIPVELNAGSGVRVGKRMYQDGLRYPYPVRIFFETFAKKHCKVLIGLDVHDPSLFLTDLYINRCLEVIEGLDVNLLYDYDLIAEAKKRKALFY